jgi:hypothetical protein
MKKCPKCGTLNNPNALKCQNEDCSQVLPQSEEKSETSQKKEPDDQKKFFNNPIVLGIAAFGIISGFNSCQKYVEKNKREVEADLQRIRMSREEVEHAREYWGKRYEDWEATIGYPAKLKGKRGELGLTPVYYPSLGMIVIINDDNQIIHVEQK